MNTLKITGKQALEIAIKKEKARGYYPVGKRGEHELLGRASVPAEHTHGAANVEGYIVRVYVRGGVDRTSTDWCVTDEGKAVELTETALVHIDVQ